MGNRKKQILLKLLKHCILYKIMDLRLGVEPSSLNFYRITF